MATIQQICSISISIVIALAGMYVCSGCVRKTKKKNVWKLRAKWRQKNKTGNEIQLNIHTNQFNDARKKHFYSQVRWVIDASAFIDTWTLQVETNVRMQWNGWFRPFQRSFFPPTSFTLTCQRRWKISHEFVVCICNIVDRQKWFMQTLYGIPMVNFYFDNSTQ